MDVTAAARRWSTAWERAWMQRDAAAIAALYAPGACYRSHPLRGNGPISMAKIAIVTQPDGHLKPARFEGR